MKTILSIILSVALVYSAQAAGTNNAPVQPNTSLVEVVFATAIAVVGAICIVSVWNCARRVPPGQGTAAVVTLMKSSDNRNWISVTSTNIVLTGSDPIEVFRESMNDPCAFYRVKVERQ